MSSLCAFSTAYCAAICAFLIPANLSATFWTLWLVGADHPRQQVKQSITLAFLLASAMSLHVLSWIAIGVVMVPTYILLGLVTVCLGLNTWALFHSTSLRARIDAMVGMVRRSIVGKGMRSIGEQPLQ